MRETPKIPVSKTLAVATKPPKEIICTARGFPETPIALARGLLDFPKEAAPRSPTATVPTRM